MLLFGASFPMTPQNYTTFPYPPFSCNLAVFLTPSSRHIRPPRFLRFLEKTLKLDGYRKKSEI